MSAKNRESGLEERAARFRERHRGPGILVLPNAWDVASARIFEEAGFDAIGTTSAGIANSLGFPDGEEMPFEDGLRVVERIAAALRIPVSADIETGFSEKPEGVAERCRAVLAAGAVGVNLEDGTREPSKPLVDVALHCEKVHAARAAAQDAGVALVINARTDVFLDSVGEPHTRLDEALRRANAYRKAGADCLFVPGVTDAETIRKLVSGIDGPINVLAGPASSPVAELQRLGVARVSLGSGPMRATLGFLRRAAAEIREKGTFGWLEGAMPYADANRLVSRTEH
ncbi:MAG TPA: isocitrate lyase/phosphoenolpyruvate mutase family protein [Thermoanaerobaculia bacterium]